MVLLSLLVISPGFTAGTAEAGWTDSVSHFFWGGDKKASGPDLPETTANVGPFEMVLAVAMVEGLALGNAWLAREAPLPYGIGMMALSPLATTSRLNGWGNGALMAGAFGIGLYNAISHGREPDTRRKRFWVTYAALHLILVPAYGLDYLTGGAGGGAPGGRNQAALDFDPERGMLVLSAGF
jgi:hypothetical protein